MFKLNVQAALDAYHNGRLGGATKEEREANGERAMVTNFARQIYADPRAAGLPKGLDAAIEALLVDRAAMQRTGEEMPSAPDVTSVLYGHFGDDADEQTWLACKSAARTTVDLFAPLCARKQRDLDEARKLARHHANEAIAERAERDALRHRAEQAEQRLALARADADRLSTTYVLSEDERRALDVRLANEQAMRVKAERHAADWESSAKRGMSVRAMLERTLASLGLPSKPNALSSAIKEMRASQSRAADALVAGSKERAMLTERIADLEAAHAAIQEERETERRAWQRASGCLAPEGLTGRMRDLRCTCGSPLTCSDTACPARKRPPGEHVHELGSCSFCDAPPAKSSGDGR